MPRTLIHNARLFESDHARFVPDCTVVIEGERIVEVARERREARAEDGATVIDAKGLALLPGLIDAHVHVVAASHDLVGQTTWPVSLVGAEASRIMREMLERGFTTVRDAGGADAGLQEAQQRGLYAGPRLFVSGFPISQTGGHADMRPRGARGPGFFCACAGLGLVGTIADGVGEVRRAVREQVRTGANQIKIMAGGGIASPSDPLEGTQFSIDELRAAVEEAEAANLYALAHAYSPRAVTRAVEAGVRSIEHGNLIDAATARVMKREGAFLVPTLSTYAALADEGERLGWSRAMLDKLEQVKGRGLEAVQIARAEGVPVVFGTDLLGHMHGRQSGEFTIRRQVQPPLEVLQGATWTAAQLMRQEAHLGRIAAGAFADLLLVAGDLERDLAPLARPEEGVRLVMQGGRVVADRRSAGQA
ncbi:MAG: amidohydrolase family protein [Betaproteobacteria bacterium]|jgi:imidazolonepropionase-like amidohydrolase|nr:amidohydrolase family protein [Betaproteobacteria bacterium]MCC6248878.1 amidohydrolase family protein [Rubrivivax sp.]MCL4697565.1 amidohydrolase family protein [Burkholderiaceae bacterium]